MTLSAPEVCVGAVAVCNDELLLVRRGHGPAAGEWSVPGGRVDLGETLAEAVVREVAEETALESICDRFLGWVERIDDERHLVILDFAVTVLDRSPPIAGSDVVEAGWVPLSDLAGRRLSEGLLEFLFDHGIVATIA